jgi:hypothetical protein
VAMGYLVIVSDMMAFRSVGQQCEGLLRLLNSTSAACLYIHISVCPAGYCAMPDDWAYWPIDHLSNSLLLKDHS